MRYYTLHNGRYWFQVRVPRRLRHRYGEVVRINLNTPDPATAKQLSLRLAADWFARFSLNLAGEECVPPPQQPIDPAAIDANTQDATPAASDSLAHAFEYWRDLVPDRPARTVLEFGATADLFDARVGKRLAALTRLDIASFRDSLLKDGLAPATVRKRLGFVSSMLQAQVDAGRLPTNVARGLRVPRPRVVHDGRLGFTAEQLRRIFGSPIYTRGHRPRGGGGEACAWLPVLALATGARLEELCQLRVGDVEAGPRNSLLLHIRGDGVQTRLKTAQSQRVVPVHRAVRACGFDDYVAQRRRARDEWLFPDLVPDTLGSRGGHFSKWFGRWLRSPRGCAIGDRRVVFHSFRHTFKTLCRAAGLEEELHDALTGHAGSVGRTYGSVPVDTLVAAVDRIELPVSPPVITARR